VTYKPKFWLPTKGGKRPAIKIIGDDGGGPLGPFNYDGTKIGRFSSRGTPMYEPGDLVVWTRVVWPRGQMDGGVESRHLARVSKVTQDGAWRPHTYHLRLCHPVEYAGGRRWAYSARLGELSEASAVDLLGRLTA